MLALVSTLNNSTTVLPFACYKTYGTAGPGKEDMIQYNGEIVFNQKTGHFAFTSPFPSRTQSHHTFREVSHCPNFHRIQCKVLFCWQLGAVVGGASRLCFTVSLPVVAVYPEPEVSVLSTHALWNKAAHWALAAHVKQTGRVSKPPVSTAIFGIYATCVGRWKRVFWGNLGFCTQIQYSWWQTRSYLSVLLSHYTSQSARICKHVTCLSCQAFSSLAFAYCLTVPFKRVKVLSFAAFFPFRKVSIETNDVIWCSLLSLELIYSRLWQFSKLWAHNATKLRGTFQNRQYYSFVENPLQLEQQPPAFSFCWALSAFRT